MTTPTPEAASDAELVRRYRRDGYVFPVDVLDAARAAGCRQELETLEKRAHGGRLGNRSQLNYPHVLFRFADAIVREPRILDRVEAILGPDILVWGSTFFIKEPHTGGFVSWHQDLRYWGLDDPEGQVSVWVALSEVDRDNGCMRFLPGSHGGPMLAHRDTYAADNVLTRGQEAAVDIDEDAAVQVELAAGQASFHHGKLLHASAPNRSDRRRIGLAINYIAAHVRQVVAQEDFAVCVRGRDDHGRFTPVPPPAEDLSADAIAWHARILDAQNQAMYDGAEQRPG